MTDIYSNGNQGLTASNCCGWLNCQPAISGKQNQLFPISSLGNLRDVGGYPTRDGGRVRTGLMYRSNEFVNISASDMEKLVALKLKYIYDLRTEAERANKPGQPPPGVEYVALDVMKDSKILFSSVQFQEFMSSFEMTEEIRDGSKVAGMIKEYYCEYVSLPSAKAAFRQLFTHMADQARLPGLYYCGSGKDRTGWASAALLTLLGVPDDIVMQDYLLSNDYFLTQNKVLFDGLKGKGVDMEIVHAIFGVWPEYMNTALDVMRKEYGTMENYFSEGLGIDPAMQQALRDIFVER